MTAPSREPTEAMREPTKAERDKAREIVAAHSTQFQREHIAGFRNIGEAIARALAAVSDEMKERAARYHIERAQVHARDATWIGPNRERYEGARVEGVEMSPMNGPAIAYDREMADAAAIRALTPEPPSEKP